MSLHTFLGVKSKFVVWVLFHQHNWFEQKRLAGAARSVMGRAGRKRLPKCFVSCCFTGVPSGSGLDSQGAEVSNMGHAGKRVQFFGVASAHSLFDRPLVQLQPLNYD